MHRPHVEKPGSVLSKDFDRFYSKVVEYNECWVWVGAQKQGKRNYGFFFFDGKQQLAHRVAYKWWKGEPPEILDHTCKRYSCVNPDHLVPATNYENVVERGSGITAKNKKKTHCPQGHEYSTANTYITPEGKRVCRICQRRRSQRWKIQNNYRG